jgi:hypothetical protein
VQGWSGEYLGGGCQHMAVLRALTGQDVVEVVAWSNQPSALKSLSADFDLNALKDPYDYSCFLARSNECHHLMTSTSTPRSNPARGIELAGFGAVDATDGSAGDSSREPAEDGSDSVFIHALLKLSGGISHGP